MDNQNLQKTEMNSGKNLFKNCICHRLPEMTFKIRNTYFPVCLMCTGSYMRVFSYYFVYFQYNISMVLTAILMILPAFSDGLKQFFGFRENSNALRFTTGLNAGIGLEILVKAVKWSL